MAKSIKKKPSEGAYTVAIPFRDKDNFSKEWQQGQDVSHFEEHRLKSLIEKGHVVNDQ